VPSIPRPRAQRADNVRATDPQRTAKLLLAVPGSGNQRLNEAGIDSLLRGWTGREIGNMLGLDAVENITLGLTGWAEIR
jgi:hypothetical protein